jgi:RimJ/RimL family protein N-acetyltransferase
MKNTPPDDLVIREAHPDDATAIIAHVNRICDEASDTIPMAPGEFEITVEQEQKILSDARASENDLFLIATTARAIIGILSCHGGKRRATRHAVTIGMSIRKNWCDRGIGTEMMQAAIAWAKGTGVVRRIELSVYADNSRAISLYRKFGFIEEGKQRSAILRDGILIDTLIMALLL